MIPNSLFVLEMANNHMGDITHGFKVIETFGEICREFPEFKFAFKLQYRDLDTFIHPKMKSRDDIKYIKRFSETRLSRSDFDALVDKMRKEGFLAMATPFDNASIPIIIEQKLDILKIASCSFNDWPLLEQAVRTPLSIIASTAGADLEDIDRVVSFLTHRNKEFVLMHCVGEYPTADDKLHINQIDFLKTRYPNVRIGFSTHENPDNTDIIKMAIAKGVRVFEKHVGLETDKYSINAYSANPDQIKKWLTAARYAISVCGVGDQRQPENIIEKASLRSLRRGVFLRHSIPAGKLISESDIYFAFPPHDDQITANDWSKYSQFISTQSIDQDSPLDLKNCVRRDVREKVWEISHKVKKLILESNITVPGGIDLEISHHYGLDRFDEFGLTMLTIVNRGYCKKLLVSLPGQRHPEQYHLKKEETFHVLYGSVHLYLDGIKRVCVPGDVVVVEPGVRHAFETDTGCIIEEISSTHHKDDSFYTDQSITNNPNRKTHLTYWMG
jgi:sialic acid synthase SpsE/mannose-6-phosphate isomerase-like protein (cupin superfamily)